MRGLQPQLLYACRRLRRQGKSYGDISLAAALSKSTVYRHTRDIVLSESQRCKIEHRRKEKCRSIFNPRKGRCLLGREIKKPGQWSVDLVHVVAHLMFDGRVDHDGCIYYSKDFYQIDHMKRLLRDLFGARPKIKPRDNGVYGLVCYHVELADYIRSRKAELLSYVSNGAPLGEKRIFLKSFFDDEGCVSFRGDKRSVRGYQKSGGILQIIRSLLGVFGIASRINKLANEIEITGRNNIALFSKEVNFSSRIYINPHRKNGVWKKKISKKQILVALLQSYKAA